MAHSSDKDEPRQRMGQSPTRSYPSSVQLSHIPRPYQSTTSRFSSNSHPNGNGFTPRRRASYYISQPTPLEFDEEDDSKIIVRAVIYVIFLVVLVLVTTAVTTRSLTNTILPRIRVVSLSVSNFTVSSQFGIRAKWNVRIQVFNPNDRFKAKMDKINIYLNYKGVRILRGDAKGFKMERNKNHSLNANLLSMGGNGTEYYPVKNAVMNEMEKDQKSGAVSFDMVMEMRINFDVDGVLNREYYASAACEGLKVGFKTAATRSGTFVNGMKSHRYITLTPF
ncbi:hypothetical protein L1049_016741 [Liquidambar formosana]|uniref:Late embryogenesis abundant protein LEA-2 subgroup domain-containing protein n=1 Tax=Liquidambar formosana TaxID=63359 RepID=A0AAP0S6U7_LIQFO